MSSRVTQSEIARRAGVHRTTVSLALRNHPSIPLPTRERIQLLAETLGYRPDPGLCALTAYRNSARIRKITSTMAYVTHWSTRWGWRDAPAHEDFHEGATRRAEQLGYRLEHFWCGDYADCPARLAAVIEARGIRGVILASHAVAQSPLLGFDWSDLSVVKIDNAPIDLPFDCVTNDQRRVVHVLFRRTLALGYRRVGLVLPKRWDIGAEFSWTAELYAMQAQMCDEQRVPALLYETPPSADSDAEMRVPTVHLREWLLENRPDAIVGFSPYVLPVLSDLDWSVPRDVAFADILLEAPTNGIAGVRQNSTRVGEVAAERVAEFLTHNVTGTPAVPVTTLVAGTWVEGYSMPPALDRFRDRNSALELIAG